MTEAEKQELIKSCASFGGNVIVDEEKNQVRIEYPNPNNADEMKVTLIFPIVSYKNEERLRQFFKELAES